MKSILRVFEFTKEYRLQSALNILFNFLSVIFSVFSIGMIVPLVDLILRENENPVYSAVEKPKSFLDISHNIEVFLHYISDQTGSKQNTLLAICGLALVFAFFKNLFRYLALYVMIPLRFGITRDLRIKIFDKILKLPIGFFNDEKKGDILSRTSSDVQEVEWSVLQSVEILFKAPIEILAYVSILLILSPKLSIFLFILIPTSGLIIGQIGKTLKKQSLLSL